ncbi:hypothetical protein D3C71_1231610 [compost metagenome]
MPVEHIRAPVRGRWQHGFGRFQHDVNTAIGQRRELLDPVRDFGGAACIGRLAEMVGANLRDIEQCVLLRQARQPQPRQQHHIARLRTRLDIVQHIARIGLAGRIGPLPGAQPDQRATSAAIQADRRAIQHSQALQHFVVGQRMRIAGHEQLAGGCGAPRALTTLIQTRLPAQHRHVADPHAAVRDFLLQPLGIRVPVQRGTADHAERGVPLGLGQRRLQAGTEHQYAHPDHHPARVADAPARTMPQGLFHPAPGQPGQHCHAQ